MASKFHAKPKRPAGRRSRPGIVGVCPKCTRDLEDGRYHDCGTQPPLSPGVPVNAPYQTDKIELGYAPTYNIIADYLLHPLRTEDVRVLEVGVATGAGMKYFRDLFNTAQVYGVDINSDAGQLEDVNRILICAQDDPALPMVLQTTWAPFDIIVDDASHLAVPTSVCLANLWELVEPGGFYVIEDWNFFEGPQMAACLWQKLAGHMLAYPSVGDPRTTPAPYSGMLDDIDTVTIRDGMIIIRKAIVTT